MDHGKLGRVGKQPARQVLPLTKAGRRQLEKETESWSRISVPIARALEAS